MIPAGKRQAVIDTLDAEGIDYVVTDETSGREVTGVVEFPLPTLAVEPVLERLRDAGIDESTYTVIVDAETVISRRFDELADAYAEEEDRDADRIAREELASRAKEMASGMSTFVVLTVVASVIATAGLLLDSAAIVVGSMVIAPLIGPAMSTSIGTVLDDRGLFRRGVRMQAIGGLLAVASAAVFAATLQALNLIPPGMDPLLIAEVQERSAPNFLVLAIAIGAGIAGIISLMTGVHEALVGVMIAVALLPPAAAVGIGIAFLIPHLAVGAAVFALVNLFSINLAALLVLWTEGYRPRSWFRAEQARGALLKRAGVLAAAIIVLSVFLGGVTYDSYAAATTEEEIRGAVVDELEAADQDLELLSLEILRAGTPPVLEAEGVVVRVGIGPGQTAPDLADRLAERLVLVLDRPVRVEVHFVSVVRSA